MARPKKSESEKLVEVPCKVPMKVAEEIESLAESQQRSRSQIARFLIERGLQSFHRDRILSDKVVRLVMLDDNTKEPDDVVAVKPEPKIRKQKAG